MAPKIIKAGAGPQDFGSGNNHDEVLQELMVQLGSDSDPGSSGGDSTTNDSGPATSYDSELELFHNVPSVCLSSAPPSQLSPFHLGGGRHL